MAALPTDRFERVRESLLHLGLRQITEEPGPDQPADFARRKARFKQNRQNLDKFRAKQSAARVAAEARVDSELRAKLEGHNGCGISHLWRPVIAISPTVHNATRPVNQMQSSFDESLIDRTKILHQSEEDFREAQVHLARKWPMIEPRNDIDLLPALRQIFQEQSPRRDDDMRSRKTYQRLIDEPQLRRLRWSEEYLLAGRFYECTPPKRNALLLQVVAEGTGDGCCERCVSDTAPFKECVRDKSEDNPWLNGACANCGTAEANSTCCHHLVGTAHLERGRSKGLTSERLREFINPTRSIELLNRLDFEKDNDSDTFSADSYAKSDTSTGWEPVRSDDGSRTIDDNDGDGQHGEMTINNFWTPIAPLEDEPNPLHQQSAMTLSDGSGGLFVSPAQSVGPFEVQSSLRMRDRSMSQGTSVSSTTNTRQDRGQVAVATGNRRALSSNATRYVGRPDSFDRSSATMAAASPASKLAYSNATQDLGRDDESESSQLIENDHYYGNVDSLLLQDSPIQIVLERHTASLESTTTSSSRAAAIQSVELFDRTPLTHPSTINATSSNGLQFFSFERNHRKRAASQPSEDEPAAFRSSTASSHSSRRGFIRSESDLKDPPMETPSANTVAESSSSGTKIDRGSTHEGCRLNWPCLHPDHATAYDGTSVPVYRNNIDGSHQFSIDEVQYILSRCTCHWASAFTKVWDGWWDFEGTPVDAEITKPQFLLSYWAEYLLEAAKECCPTEPNSIDAIIID